jgi:hypothetical protein
VPFTLSCNTRVAIRVVCTSKPALIFQQRGWGGGGGNRRWINFDSNSRNLGVIVYLLLRM